MPRFDFLIGVAGNTSRWRYTLEAPTLTHATNELLKIASLSHWSLMSDAEVQSLERAELGPRVLSRLAEVLRSGRIGTT